MHIAEFEYVGTVGYACCRIRVYCSSRVKGARVNPIYIYIYIYIYIHIYIYIYDLRPIPSLQANLPESRASFLLLRAIYV